MIIGILGKKRNGKDTCADYLVDKYNFEKIAIATPLKEIIKIMFDYDDDVLNTDLKEVVDEKWNVTPRKLLQYIGTDLIRKDLGKYINKSTNNIWIDLCITKINKSNKNFVISDVRCQNEVDAIRNNGGIVIKIIRDTNLDDNHVSEIGVDNIDNYDYLIDNNFSYQQLYNNLDKIMCAKYNII